MKILGRELQFHAPKRAPLLIVDQISEDSLLPVLINYSFETVDTRGRKLNALILLLTMLKVQFWRGNKSLSYLDQFTKFVKPKLMMTLIDNDPNFLELCERWPDIKAISIQNGWREEFNHLTGIDKRKLDHYLVFNEDVENLVNVAISGEGHPIGSLRNNFYPLPRQRIAETSSVIFISQFEPDSDRYVYKRVDGALASWEQFYAAEVRALNLLAVWCSSKGLELQVKSRYGKPLESEIAFFRGIPGLQNVRIINCGNHHETYLLLDSGAMFVTIDSTLGYEALARGSRVALISTRNDSLGRANLEFGWPADLPGSGIFWVSEFDETEVNAMLDRVYEGKVDQAVANRVIRFDEGNVTLRNLLALYLQPQ